MDRTSPEGTPAGGPPSRSPWARPAGQIDETYDVVSAQVVRIAGRAKRTAEQLSPDEHYALGVRAAARWTMGLDATAPLTDDALPPDLDSVIKVMGLAECLVNGEGAPEQAAALAAGVRAWLVWLIGAEETMVLRPVD